MIVDAVGKPEMQEVDVSVLTAVIDDGIGDLGTYVGTGIAKVGVQCLASEKLALTVDLGKAGPADRWQDIAIAIRSLDHNFDGRYFDGKPIFDFKPQMFLDALGVEMNEEKYRYYYLLDELF